MSGNTSIEDLVARLNNRLEKLSTSLSSFRSNDFADEEAPFRLLIATGLNPAQFTKITSRIEEVEAKLGRELTVEDLIAGVGNIIPAPGDDTHKFSGMNALSLLVQDTRAPQDTNLNNPHEFTTPNDAEGKNKASGPIQNHDVQALLNMIAANKIAPASTQPNALQPTIGDTTILPEDGITPLPQALSNAEF